MDFRPGSPAREAAIASRLGVHIPLILAQVLCIVAAFQHLLPTRESGWRFWVPMAAMVLLLLTEEAIVQRTIRRNNQP